MCPFLVGKRYFQVFDPIRKNTKRKRTPTTRARGFQNFLRTWSLEKVWFSWKFSTFSDFWNCVLEVKSFYHTFNIFVKMWNPIEVRSVSTKYFHFIWNPLKNNCFKSVFFVVFNSFLFIIPLGRAFLEGRENNENIEFVLVLCDYSV